MDAQKELTLIGSIRGIVVVQLEPEFIGRFVREHRTEITLALGALLRIGTYLWDRPYWQDEGSLLENIHKVCPFDFSGPLHFDQLAPFGFLIIERLLVSLLGDLRLVVRFFPLCCGLTSLWFFHKLSGRCLSARPALLAIVLFSMSDDLVYYSSELKPYSLDLLSGLAITLGALRFLKIPMRCRDLVALLLLAVFAPWFSFPSAFFVGGCGVVLICDRAHRQQMLELAGLLGVAACWLSSFAAAYHASHGLLSSSTSMYVFWGFAFLPAPPQSLDELHRFVSILLEFFINPLNLLAPFLPRLVIVVPVILAEVGGVLMYRSRTLQFFMLSLPVLLALLASALQEYPFHGRLILALAPAFYLFIAAGTEAVRSRFGRSAYIALLVIILSYPCASAFYHALGVRARDFQAHGDLHQNRFDSSSG